MPGSKGAVDFVDLRVVGNVQVFFRNHGAVGIRRDDFILKKVHLRGFHDPLDEQQAGQYQSELNGYNQVEYHGEEESDKQDGHIGLRIAQKFPECPPTAYVIAHNDQYARQACHRNVLRQWHEQQKMSSSTIACTIPATGVRPHC